MNLKFSKAIGIAMIAMFAFAAAQSNAGHHKKEERKDIVDTAVAAGKFETLAAALGAADLIDTLKGDGPFTVFAPTDEAFAKLPEGTVENLLKPENKDQLVKILTYLQFPTRKLPQITLMALRTAKSDKHIAQTIFDYANSYMDRCESRHN